MVGRRSVRLIVFGSLALATSVSEAQRVEWTTSISAPSSSISEALHPLATDASGNVFVVGNVVNGTTFNIVTVKLAPNGNEAWRATLQSSIQARAYAITTDSAGNVMVAASLVPAPGSPPGYLTVKYDAGGNELWRRLAQVPPFGVVPSAIAADRAGNVYVTGGSPSAYAGDFFTIKYAADGTELWRASTDGGSHLGDTAHAIALDGAGNVYIAGVSFYHIDIEGSFSTGELLKYDSAGTLQWTSGIDGGGERGNGVDVATDGAGNVYFAATSTTGSGLFNVPILQLARFDAQGNRLWSVNATGQLSGLTGEGSVAHALAVDRLGNAYLTGQYWQVLGINTRYTYLTLKYGPTGVEQWRAIDSSNLVQGSNYGQGLVVTANEDVIVTGQRGFNGPGTTLTYDVGGQVRWRVEQPVFTPSAIAGGPANSVYVAGATVTGLVIQKIVDDSAPDAAAMIPATSRGALLALAVMVLVLAACHRSRWRTHS